MFLLMKISILIFIKKFNIVFVHCALMKIIVIKVLLEPYLGK